MLLKDRLTHRSLGGNPCQWTKHLMMTCVTWQIFFESPSPFRSGWHASFPPCNALVFHSVLGFNSCLFFISWWLWQSPPTQPQPTMKSSRRRRFPTRSATANTKRQSVKVGSPTFNPDESPAWRQADSKKDFESDCLRHDQDSSLLRSLRFVALPVSSLWRAWLLNDDDERVGFAFLQLTTT